jgi:hypothetical protein
VCVNTIIRHVVLLPVMEHAKKKSWWEVVQYLRSVPTSTVRLEKLMVPRVHINSPHFMEHEISLPHSQQPATCSYHHTNQSNPCQRILVLTYFLILSPHLCERLPSELSPAPLHPQQPHLSISAVSSPTGTSIHLCRPTFNSVPFQATSVPASPLHTTF